MSGTKTFTASLFLAAASAGLAADVNYFPLHTGNQWIYWSSGPARGGALSLTAEIPKSAVFGGAEYAFYTGLEGDQYLRMDDNGTLYAWDSQSKTEVPVAPFAGDDGVFVPRPNPCGQKGSIVSRSAKYKGPLGEFDNALEIRYSPGTCADAGLEREVYLPWIGLVQRTTTTIAGPRTYDLTYARIGGVNVVSGPEVSFSLALDQNVHRSTERLLVRLSVRNVLPDTLRLQFRSGQTFDVAIRNDKDERVYLWSADKAFTMALKYIDVSGEKNFPVDVPLDKLAPGNYTVDAWLTTTSPGEWRASAPLEIR